MTNNIVFSGSLLFVSLADVFQLLGDNSCTGILILRSSYSADPGFIYFSNGNPINASYGTLKGIKAIHALFGWTDGKYEFSEENLTGIEPVISQGRMGIVMDALRLLDEGVVARVGPDLQNQSDAEKNELDVLQMAPVKGPMIDYLYAKGEYSYPDGATIVKEGKYGRWLWVICDGTVRIIRETPKGNLTLARLSEGCFVGTVRALAFGEYQRNASVVAEGNVQLCILDAEPLYREYSALSENFRKILLSLDHRLRMLNDNSVCAYLGDYAKELPQDKVCEDKYQTKTDLYIIKEGKADIIGKGLHKDMNILTLGRGDVFGKIPFVDFAHEPSFASVLTSEPFTADLLDSQALQREYENLSRTFRNFVFHTAASISITTKLFYHLLQRQAESAQELKPGQNED